MVMGRYVWEKTHTVNPMWAKTFKMLSGTSRHAILRARKTPHGAGRGCVMDRLFKELLFLAVAWASVYLVIAFIIHTKDGWQGL